MFKTKITGTYYLGKEVMAYLRELPVNIKLNLEHEKNNPYDENAIKVLSDEVEGSIHLGYIPKEINVEILDKINEGKKLEVIYKGKSSIEIFEGDEEKLNMLGKIF